MSAARGDRKPCIRTACPGTMQFDREPLPNGPATRAADGERGWVCSENVDHFQRASERSASELVARKSADGRWDDDGGAERPASF
jgi:hypothetical protein